MPASSTTSNNITAALVIAAFLALASLFLPWGSFTSDAMTLQGISIRSMTITITGTNGSLGLAGMSLPTWLLSAITAVSAVVLLLNHRGITTIPRWVPLIALTITLVFVMAGMVAFIVNGGIMIGVIVACLATLVTICLGLIFGTTTPAERA